MKPSKRLVLISIFFLILFTACTSTPSQQPTSLKVQRVGLLKHGPPQNWTIADTKSIQQLFQEIHNLPVHHNNGTDACAESFYVYHLDFFVGTKSIEKDDLGAYCRTLTTPDGTSYDPTDSFISSFAKEIHVSPDDV